MTRTPRILAALAIAAVCVLTASAAPASELHRRAWLIMGTVLEVTVEADSFSAARGFEAAYAMAARVDSLMSLYKPDSEITRLNREGYEHPVPVSRETAEVIAAGLAWAESTGGAFDITVKPVMDRWGFYRKAGQVPGDRERDSLAALVGWKNVNLDKRARTVRLLKRGTAIDLGGIAKGYAVDLMAEALLALGVKTALVNLGGNMRGLGAPEESPEGWPVAIRDPARPDSLLSVLPLRNASISSSGGYEKFVTIGGRTWGHIVDPRTAAPVEGMLGTTVIAPDAMTADILSTAFFVMGIEDGLELARRLSGVEALCVSASGPGENAVYTGNGIFGEFHP
jgi:FAD:protein FMN transferase